MNTVKQLAGLTLVVGLATGSVAANAGTVTVDTEGHRNEGFIDDYGRRNDTVVIQRGKRNRGSVSTQGTDLKTRVNQLGSNAKLNVNVEGRGLETHVFTGICPPGSAPREVDVRGYDALKVIVPRCN